MKLSIHLVAWNGAKYIAPLFESLKNQTYRDWELVVVDNGSSDGTMELIKNELNNFSVQWRIIENKENLGFARGHNQALAMTDAEYFLLLNQDIKLEPDCLEKLVKFLNARPEAAVVAPRLMKWSFQPVIPAEAGIQPTGSPIKSGMTNDVDSLGLKILRNRRVVEATGFTSPPPLLSKEREIGVFGVSGACALLRRRAVEQVLLYGGPAFAKASAGEVFDESYFAYKEDVDLAYRLRQAGWQAFVLPDAVAEHDRAGAGAEGGDWAAARNKKRQPDLISYHSYKNHLTTLYKNEYWQNFLLDSPWILWYELKKVIYFLLFNRAVLAGLKEIWRSRKELKIKRLNIKRLRKVSWREMRRKIYV